MYFTVDVSLNCTIFVCDLITLDPSAIIKTPEPTSAGKCKPGFIEYGKDCFMLNSDTKTWAEADSYCKGQGGNLASIHDHPTNAFLHILTANTQSHVWIGLSDKEVKSGE